jgi:murein DD-endopeptidase MepM/ murein hydrolase activator NlpD
MRLFILLVWMSSSIQHLNGQARPAISLPLNHLRLTSAFGYRIHPLTGSWRLHSAIDLAADRDSVLVVLDGKILKADYDPALGLFLRVAHFGDLESIYGHLSRFLAIPGQCVRAGDPIAISGASGLVTGPHLHFGLCYRKQFVDPLLFFYACRHYLPSRPRPN